MSSKILLQFGCGSNRLPAFRNFDADLDVTKPLPFENEHADMCFAEHLCEHLDSRELLGFLTECHRILKPGGVMRMICPVVGPWLAREWARDLATNHGHKLVLTEEVMRTFLWMAGFDQQNISRTDRDAIDSHWTVIGKPKDSAESCRMLATK